MPAVRPPLHLLKKAWAYQSGQRRPFTIPSFVITGVTKDSSGAVLPGCLVKLYATATDQVVTSTFSDSVTGAYSFPVSDQQTYYAIAYKAGSPDVTGATVNTLTGV